MVELYYKRIIKDKMALEKVPKRWRTEVAAKLEKEGA